MFQKVIQGTSRSKGFYRTEVYWKYHKTKADRQKEEAKPRWYEAKQKDHEEKMKHESQKYLLKDEMQYQTR